MQNSLQTEAEFKPGPKDIAKDVIVLIQDKKKVPFDMAFYILNEYEKLTKIEPNVLELELPICIVADMHSQLFDMIKIIKTAQNEQKMQRFLFLGDYVDRGDYPVETFIYLCCRKILDPKNFFMIRGNHETTSVSKIYGLKESCDREYTAMSLFERMNEVFKALPVAAIVGKSIFCVHAGISPCAPYVEDICLIDRFVEISKSNEGESSILEDITWSDPDESIDIFIENGERGIGYRFGEKQVEKFLNDNGLKLIIRAHEVQPEGYRWYFSKRLLSLWSAAKYSECPEAKATYAIVDENAELKLIPIEASEEKGYYIKM